MAPQNDKMLVKSSSEDDVQVVIEPAPLCFFLPAQIFSSILQDVDNDASIKRSAAGFLSQMNTITASVQASATASSSAIPTENEHSGENNGLYRQIYDLQQCKDDGAFPGVLCRSEGDSALGARNTIVDLCYDKLGIVFNFFHEVFDRKGIDGKGSPLIGIVNYDFYFPGAWWARIPGHTSEGMTFGNGFDYDPFQANAPRPYLGGYFGNFLGSIEVIAHEMTHGIVRSITHLQDVGEAGALHEHLADVFGIMCEQWHKKQSVDQADWLIGEDLVLPQCKGMALRSMKEPGNAYDFKGIGKDDQVDHYSKLYKAKIDEEGVLTSHERSKEVHINSGIPNLAFYKVCKALGGNSWDVAGKIWWTALNAPTLRSDSTLKTWANITRAVASEPPFDVKTGIEQIVVNAWIEVGLGRKRV